jgi:hypothetical protein
MKTKEKKITIHCYKQGSNWVLCGDTLPWYIKTKKDIRLIVEERLNSKDFRMAWN